MGPGQITQPWALSDYGDPRGPCGRREVTPMAGKRRRASSRPWSFVRRGFCAAIVALAYVLAIASPASAGVTFASLATGGSDTCALGTDGSVYCWGAGAGTGSLGYSTIPVEVPGMMSGVTAIAAGGDHNCALTSGGAVECWGSNSDGQLGNGNTTDSVWAPVQVAGLTSGVTAIARRRIAYVRANRRWRG